MKKSKVLLLSLVSLSLVGCRDTRINSNGLSNSDSTASESSSTSSSGTSSSSLLSSSSDSTSSSKESSSPISSSKDSTSSPISSSSSSSPISSSDSSSSSEPISSSKDSSSSPISSSDSSSSSESSTSSVVEKETISIPTFSNGSITSNKDEALVGETITLTITPDTGYQLKSLKVNGEEIEVDENGQVTIVVTKDMTITAEFELIDYSINIDSTSIQNGTVTSDKTSANLGDTVTLTVTPDNGYRLKSLKVNGQEVSVDENNQAKVEVTKNMTVTAEFELIDYTVNIDSSNITNGTITADKETANIGDTITLTVTPDEGYELKSLMVNGVEVEVDENNQAKVVVSENMNVTAEFTAIDYAVNIDSTSITNGKITADKDTANLGETVTLTVTPDEGYKLKSLKVNGVEVEVDANNQAKIVVSKDMTVTAEFESLDFAVTINDDNIEHGKVTTDKTTAKIGETVTLTVAADTDYYLNSITVNGELVEVDENNQVKVVMSKDGIIVDATFGDSLLVDEFDETTIARISKMENCIVTLKNDIELTSLPKSSGTITYNLNGHTITTTSSTPLIDSTDEDSKKSIIIKNGSIKNESTSGCSSIIDGTYLAGLTLDNVTISNTTEYTGSNKSSAIILPSAGDTSIISSTINYLGDYGISTNVDASKEVKTTIKDSTIVVTSDDKNNTGLLIDNANYSLTITASSITGDRQALVGRQGNFTLSNSTFTTTGKYVSSSEDNASKDKTYKEVADSWLSGNEVVSASVTLGDESSSTGDSTANINSCSFKHSEETTGLSIHSDAVSGTSYKTETTIDAISYINAYSSIDNDNDTNTSLTISNYYTKSVTELNNMTASSTSDLYEVTGIITEIDTTTGYITIKDSSNNTIKTKVYTLNTYSCSSSTFSFDTSNNTLAVSSLSIGLEIVVAGLVTKTNKVMTLENAVLLDSYAPKANITLPTDTSKGTVSLSVNGVETDDVRVGDSVIVNVTPVDGYSVSTIIVNHADNSTSVITDSKTFIAQYGDEIKVSYSGSGYYELSCAIFSEDHNDTFTGNYSKTVGDFTYSLKSAGTSTVHVIRNDCVHLLYANTSSTTLIDYFEIKCNKGNITKIEYEIVPANSSYRGFNYNTYPILYSKTGSGSYNTSTHIFSGSASAVSLRCNTYYGGVAGITGAKIWYTKK